MGAFGGENQSTAKTRFSAGSRQKGRHEKKKRPAIGKQRRKDRR